MAVAATQIMYKSDDEETYTSDMDVSISELRANLSHWLHRAQAGDEIVVTDRGRPVARITGVGVTAILERLIRDGTVIPAKEPKVSLRELGLPRVIGTPGKPFSDYVTEQRGR
jgi:prevent-host-death family protein